MASQSDQVTMILIPMYKELGVNSIWDFVKETEDLIQYFPTYEEGSLPESSFLWRIFCILRKDAWKVLLKEARNRRGKKEVEEKKKLIEIDPQILDKLMSGLYRKSLCRNPQNDKKFHNFRRGVTTKAIKFL